MADYIKSFIIGSSLPVILPFHYAVQQIPETTTIIDKEAYPIQASLYFGSANVLSKLMGNYMGWDLKKRLFITCIFSIILIATNITIRNVYGFTSSWRWIQQYLLITIGHLYAYMFVIYQLETLFA